MNNNKQLLSKHDIYSLWIKTRCPEKSSYKVRFLFKKEKVYGIANFGYLEEVNRFIDVLKENGYEDHEYEVIKREECELSLPDFSVTDIPPNSKKINGYSNSFKKDSPEIETTFERAMKVWNRSHNSTSLTFSTSSSSSSSSSSSYSTDSVASFYPPDSPYNNGYYCGTGSDQGY